MSRLLEIDPDSSPWWEALSAGEVRIPHCGTCGTFFFPPSRRCPTCRSLETSLDGVSGLGSVVTWTTTAVALADEFADDLPFTVVLVKLDEGPRILGRLLEGAANDGLRVRVSPYEAEGSTLIGFTPDDAAS